MEKMRDTIRTAALKAGEILMRHYGRIESIETKSADIDLVTIADRESEEAVISIIREAFPDHAILAEESGGGGGNAGYQWVIDPLDGTTNYAHSFPAFCVSIGVMKENRPVLASVFNPYYNEYFHAERGKGAFLNDRRIHASAVSDLSRALLVTGFAYDRRDKADHLMRRYRDFMMCCHDVRRVGAAALDLCSVACGRLDGYWEENLKPWDTAAGWLILEEAGGRVTDFSGGEFRIEKKQLLATNSLIHDEMIKILSGQA